ncbi:non-ribosomal peptide synthetase [Janthinobacterium agaricidamnosum]|uniref:NRPS II ORF 1 n=1 Tax=Janthinobacterium agaricidamnosum NBRC 102515 = DSM 9628 TaxID=1349767 RepID=W0V446_9BURK|nr:non-ribosomal peptide synthetase [Janthinobacterium agaricidamnosum]CDG82375.1 NRPS II ORF 1 [Janthinobacterium agaricidamnosum NBRC 102515 = DSM 9628]
MNQATAVRNFPRNMVEHLQTLARTRPRDTALIALGAGGESRFDYGQLDQLARAMAVQLQARFGPGERALLLLDNDQHYLVAFFGCLYAGLVAVPVFPPESAREQHLERLLAIAADAGACCILGTGAILALLGEDGGAARFGAAAALAVDALDPASAGAWRAHVPQETDIAFLQYTSGSTAVPKGVMVSHANLMANERAIESSMAVTADDVFVTWLPLYHDMGLIGGALQPLHRGIPVVLMSPSYFLQRPLRWLEAVSRYRGTVSGGPDFAFRLCLERIKPEQAAALDLSSWRVAFSGAEPVRHDTLSDFMARFAPAGLRPSAIYPCYGLAEATLLVSGGVAGSGMTSTRFAETSVAAGLPLAATGDQPQSELVGCGPVTAGHRVDIVAPDTLRTLADGQVGEILASGPSVAAGYWRRTDASAETFIERDGRRCLRTGDLGFMHQGQLYITGRLKDVIILRGQNFYPQDIERAIEMEVEAVRKGRVAAFAVSAADGGEGVGVCAEVSRGLQKLVPPAALAEALSQAASLVCRNALTLVVLLNPGGLPKTSSGKLRRGACRQGWLDGTLDAYAVWSEGRIVQGAAASANPADAGQAPRPGTESELAQLWREVLKLDPAAPLRRDAHFFGKGGNSLAAVQLAARAGARWNIDIAPQLLFEHPQLADCALRIDGLRSAGAARGSGIAVLPEALRGAGVPLSHAQQRLWFLWRLDPAGTAYHIGGRLTLDGALDVASLDAALLHLLQRHESLRTSFRAGADGSAEQLIGAAPAQSGLLRLAQDDDGARLLEQPFDLTQGPLLRAGLRRDAGQRHTLVLVLHHIIADAWSMQRLIEELAACYQAYRGGAEPALPALPVQYADYAAWQRQRLDGGERVRQLDYWRGALGSHHPVLDLRTDRPRGAARRYTAAQHGFTLPPGLAADLRARAGQAGATLFSVLLAAFQALLFRHSGQQDLRIGVPVANRGRPEVEGVVGFFVNTQVLRSQLGPRMTLAALLQQARVAALGAQAHQELPFDELVEALQPQRSLSHNPLFQVLFNHLVEDYRALSALPGLALEVRALEQPEVQFDLALDTVETPDGQLRVAFSYAAELFDATTIAGYGRHYLALLRQLAAAPECALAEVDLDGAAGRAQLLAWGRNDGAALATLPAHLRFERQAAAQPHAEALVCGAEALTYDALNRRANRLARRLMADGAGPGTLVGVALERSPDMVVGLLAILKAGAAYVPLDPDYPAGRLLHMARDSGLAMLLTHSRLDARLPALDGVARLRLDGLALDGLSDANPGVAVHGDSLAYVIYTSGSTGTPKGVGIGHAALARHIDVSAQFFGLRADDRMLQFATLNFDGFIEQLFPPLALGAAVVLRGPDLWDSAAFYEQLIAQRISVADLTTAYWAVLAQDFAGHGRRDYGALRQVHAGGEALPPEALHAWRDAGLQHVKLLNTYGPTEATVTASALDCAPYLAPGARLPAQMPIGAPLAGRRLYVLDSELGLAPPGVAGELYIGGALLARGYLNRPGLSAERFVADPFGADGGRLYRSGDLVRWLADGQLEYLGRIDHQVKLRGLRVELGEIEARLLAQPGVRAAVVSTQQAGSGALLVAHVAADPGVELQGAALRSALRGELPDYMVPSAVMVLAALPLNPNGKVDRHALPLATPSADAEHVAPLGQAEQALALLWQEVLGLPRVGRHDNFFELGGHSLAAIRVTALLAQRHACELPVRRFFDAPTLAGMAQGLSEAGFDAGGAARARRLDDMANLLSEFEEQE